MIRSIIIVLNKEPDAYLSKTNEPLCLVRYLTLIIELTGERRSPRSVKRAKSTTFAAGLAGGRISADDDDHAKVIMNRDNHLSYHHFSPAMHRETHTTNAPRREKDTPISLFAVTLFEHRFETRRTNDQISVLFSLSLSLSCSNCNKLFVVCLPVD